MVCYYKVGQLFYYKVRQVLQSVKILLQSATGITKCDDYYKVRQYKRLRAWEANIQEDHLISASNGNDKVKG